MRFQQLFNPTLSNPMQSGGLGGALGGASNAMLNIYPQMTQNRYLAPLLQQQLMQQQQKTQQMQAQTPFMAQLAHNEAINAFPFGQLGFLLQNDPSIVKYPGLISLLSGQVASQLGGTVNPNATGTAGALGYQPTTPLKLGAMNVIDPNTGQVVPGSQQKTWMGNIARGAENLGMKVLNALKQPSNIGNNVPATSQGVQSGSFVPSKKEMQSNAPNYSWLNSNTMNPSQKAQKVMQLAQQEYEAEHGFGSWKKASPSEKKSQWDMIYSSMQKSIKSPYGA